MSAERRADDMYETYVRRSGGVLRLIRTAFVLFIHFISIGHAVANTPLDKKKKKAFTVAR